MHRVYRPSNASQAYGLQSPRKANTARATQHAPSARFPRAPRIQAERRIAGLRPAIPVHRAHRPSNASQAYGLQSPSTAYTGRAMHVQHRNSPMHAAMISRRCNVLSPLAAAARRRHGECSINDVMILVGRPCSHASHVFQMGEINSEINSYKIREGSGDPHPSKLFLVPDEALPTHLTPSFYCTP